MQYKFPKTILVWLCAVVITLVSACALSACGTIYHSEAGKMQDLTGTYKLTTYNQKDDGNDVNRIDQWHVKAYLVVGADGYGYYAYQDDSTEFWYDSILINYNHEDNSDLYKSIQFTTGVSQEKRYINHQKPGNGYEPPMGFNVNNKTLSYLILDHTPMFRGDSPSYYTSVVYTKISDDTNLDKVASELNRTLAPLPRYELKNFNGTLIFSAGMPNHEVAEKAGEPEKANNPLYNKYKYYVIDFDAVHEKANCYYELVNGEGQQTQTDVEVPVTITNENGIRKVAIKFFDQEYTATVSSIYSAPIIFNYEVSTKFYPDENGIIVSSQVYGNSIQGYYVNSSVQDVIDAQLAEYNRTANN